MLSAVLQRLEQHGADHRVELATRGPSATPSLKAKESAEKLGKARWVCMCTYFQSGVNAEVGSEHSW